MIRAVKRRLLLVSAALVGLSASLFLIFDGLRESLVFFYSPTELLAKSLKDPHKIRVGGMVKAGSLTYQQNQKISFILTDYTTDVRVEYEGIPPSLFREGQGAVAEGFLSAGASFKALTILVKHDEAYMPPRADQDSAHDHGQKTLKEDR